MGLDVKHRCDGRTHPTPRQGEQAVLFWGRPAMANAVASGRESACPRSCCRASTRSAAAELNGAIAMLPTRARAGECFGDGVMARAAVTVRVLCHDLDRQGQAGARSPSPRSERRTGAASLPKAGCAA